MKIEVEIQNSLHHEDAARLIREMAEKVTIKSITYDPYAESSIVYFVQSLGFDGELISEIPRTRKAEIKPEWPKAV